MAYDDSYLGRTRAANASMGKKARAVRAEQQRVANIVASKVGEALDWAVNGPVEDRGKYMETGVLGSKGFLQAAAKVAGAATKRMGIQEMKQTMLSRAAHTGTEGVFPKTSAGWKLGSSVTSPEMHAEEILGMAPIAAKAAAKDLTQTLGVRRAYTALKADAAAAGRNLSTDVRKVNYAIDKYGGDVAGLQIFKWHQARQRAEALAAQAKKIAAAAPKGVKKQAK